MKMGFELTSYQHFYGDKLLESMQQFMVKIRENEKESTHRFNVVWQIAYVYGNKEEDFHYVSN